MLAVFGGQFFQFEQLIEHLLDFAAKILQMLQGNLGRGMHAKEEFEEELIAWRGVARGEFQPLGQGVFACFGDGVFLRAFGTSGAVFHDQAIGEEFFEGGIDLSEAFVPEAASYINRESI